MPMLRPLVLLLACAGCATVPVTERRSDAPTTPISYKAGTPRDQRAFDINECELGARGVRPGASAEEIAAGTARTTPERREAYVRACMQDRGYTMTELPVCQPGDRDRGTLVMRPNLLPPLDSIVCLDPSIGGMVTTQPPAPAAGPGPMPAEV